MEVLNENNVAVIEKKKENMNYIVEHIQNVQIAFERLFLNNIDYICEQWEAPEVMRDAINEVAAVVKHHDESKFSDEEFEGYRLRFYPTKEEESTLSDDYRNQRYQDAWKHHYTNNDHHPLYWCDEKKRPVRNMSLIAIVHMLSDWEGMSIKFGGSTYDWYYKEAGDEQAAMTDQTKLKVEKLLDILFKR